MNGLERIHKALKREEPDRVPHFEFLVDKKVREAIKPGISIEDFYVFMDVDGIGLPDKNTAWRYELVNEAERLYRDQWGGYRQIFHRGRRHPPGAGDKIGA